MKEGFVRTSKGLIECLYNQNKKVAVRVREPERVISPVENTWDEFFRNGPQVSDDFMLSRGDQTQDARESF
jgi:antitoxin VapB